MNTTELAQQLCERMERQFPGLEMNHFDAVDFFHDFFDPPGLPYYQDERVPVWEEPGHLVYLEAKGIFYWDGKACDFTSFQASDSDDTEIVLLYLYDDGRVGMVNDQDGTASIIGRKYSLEQLARILQLCFAEGRRHLADDEEVFTGTLNSLRQEARSFRAVTGSEKSALPGNYGLSGAALQKYLKEQGFQ